MTHGQESLTRELNEAHRKNALRVFITGLNAPLSNILFSLSPSDLPSALAKAQELESNNQRAQFALQFNRNTHDNTNNSRTNNDNTNNNHLRFPKRCVWEPNTNNYRHKYQQSTPMVLGSSNMKIPNHRENHNNNFNNNNWRSHNNNNNNNNVGQRINPFRQNHNNYNNNFQRNWYVDKRPHSAQNSAQPPVKNQRVNNINEDAFLGDPRVNYPTYLDNNQESN